jgi:hypothetical protein
MVLGLTAAVVVTGAGSASAYWTAHKSGSGTANTATGTVGLSFTTNAVPAKSADLYPTGPKGNLRVQINRVNAKNIIVNTMAFDSSRSVTVGGALGACAGTVITLTSASSLGWSVPAGSGVVTFDLPSVVKIDDAAPSTCQGATFTIPIILTGVYS